MLVSASIQAPFGLYLSHTPTILSSIDNLGNCFHKTCLKPNRVPPVRYRRNRQPPGRNVSFPTTPSRRDSAPGNTRDSSDTSFFRPGFSWLFYIPGARRLFAVPQCENPEQRTSHRNDTSFPMTPPFGIA